MGGRKWTAEEDVYIREHIQEQTDEEIAAALGRTKSAVETRRFDIGVYKKKWTPSDVEYLESRWGNTAIPFVAKKLGRSISSVKQKAMSIGLPGDPLNASEYITMNVLCMTMGKHYHNVAKKWKENGCPIKKRRMVNMKIDMILLDDFWRWAERHKELVDLSGLQENDLGAEPAWVKEKRKQDLKKRVNRAAWTPEEENRLRDAVRHNRFTYLELSTMFNRSERALRRKIGRLGLQNVQVKRKIPRWNAKDVETLLRMRDGGESWKVISTSLKRTEVSCRMKYYHEKYAEMF